MTKKKPPLDLANRTHVDVTVEGVQIRVYLDGKGRPIAAAAGFWEGPDDVRERLVRIALRLASDHQRRAAEAVKRKLDSDTAANESKVVRAEAAKAHFANHWFTLVHELHPRYGRRRLAAEARKAALLNADMDEALRDEITEDRARQFLERQGK